MKKTFLFFALLLSCCSIFGQFTKEDHYNVIDNKIFTFSKEKPNASFDSIVSFVNFNFKTSEEKVRAYYTWIALNIAYDTEHMKSLDLMQMFNLNTISSSNQKSPDVLKNKKAVCEGYSNLMVDFCKASSVPCFMVTGYTKTPSGEIPNILHAWNVLRVDSAWTFVDITWSSGYVNPMGEYVKRFSNQYFSPRPKNFIKDHLPLDPMWQLLKNPFTKQDFENDSLIRSKSPAFNFPDSIRSYQNKSKAEQEYLDLLHWYKNEPSNLLFAKNLDVYHNNKLADKLNVGALYHMDFTDFGKSKLSKNPTLSDCKKAKVMLDSAEVNYTKVQHMLSSVKANTLEYQSVFSKMQKSVNENRANVKLNYDYLKKLQAYLAKKK